MEIEDGRITYVGPREPRGDVIDVTGKVLVAGLHRAAHAPVVPVLAVVAARGRGPRRHDDARLRQPLLLPLARRRRPAPIVDQMNAAPAHVYWVARIAPQSAYPDEASGSRSSVDRADAVVARGGGVSGEITNWSRSRAASRGFAAGIAAAKAARRRVEGHNAGASYDRLQRALARRGSPPTTRRSRARRRCAGCGSGCGRCCASPRCGRTSSRCCASSRRWSTRSRRLMFTTDGAMPSLLRRARRDRRRAADRHRRGVDPMRALQMATIDPATFLGLDEELGGIAPGRHATLNVLPEIGEWRPGARVRRRARSSRATARSPPRSRRSTGPPARGSSRRRPRPFAPLTGIAARRPLRERGDQPPPTTARSRRTTQAVLVARDGTWVTKGVVENFLDDAGFRDHRDDLAASCSCSAPTRPRWPARPRRWRRWAAGSRSTAAGRAPLEIDGLIAAGGLQTRAEDRA